MAQQPVTLALAGYSAAAQGLIPHWLALESETCHAPVLHLLPSAPARIADIGAGIGNDAAWLAGKGHSVLAVEPVDAFREAGVFNHLSPDVVWVNDRLPDLTAIRAHRGTFDLVKLTAVWAHLDPDERTRAMPVLAALLAPGGRMIMSVRSGWSPSDRPVFPADNDRTIALAQAEGLPLIFRTEAESIQAINRAHGVTWTWLVFERDA